jgi:hypothetical protein
MGDAMTAKEKGSINKTARLAGGLYLSLALFSGFGIMYVPSALVVPGDAATTASNIMASEGLFRISMVSHLIGQTVFIFLVLALYKLLKLVNKDHAVLMVVLALLGVPIAFLFEVNHLAVLQLLSGTDYLTAFDTDQLHAQAMLFLDLRNYGILIAQIFWGLWLLPLGYLIFRSGFLPRVLGVLVMVGGFGYVFDSVFKGVNVEKWERRALEDSA